MAAATSIGFPNTLYENALILLHDSLHPGTINCSLISFWSMIMGRLVWHTLHGRSKTTSAWSMCPGLTRQAYFHRHWLWRVLYRTRKYRCACWHHHKACLYVFPLSHKARAFHGISRRWYHGMVVAMKLWEISGEIEHMQTMQDTIIEMTSLCEKWCHRTCVNGC